MDTDLLSAFLSTLKEVNATLLELTKITASNQLAIRLIGGTFLLGGGSFLAWFFTHMDAIISLSNAATK